MTTTAHLGDFRAIDLTGTDQPLEQYVGKVVLVVNTASKCGLTPQFEGLESLYQDLREEGLEILGFPCNQFAGQEPGDAEQIGDFCQRNYGVSFPMFDKIDVNGPHAHPLYRWLKKETRGVLTGGPIKWNFTKFLVARDGSVVRRYAPTTEPAAIAEDIRAELAR
ncbi:glutathione peroxidase [Demequina zhanjiangensis]|uniref:Glutathione peroxidase n=1 Tax=Demequina zhanjiangensis TaxID=3051659 RepID=A0ABT8G2V4_9MICO|nr:glutathione peroxidase [Demequina sp. SYSU T00b26]MDN4473259.1 glutathione peroxidase [Demequina sp. SYSU T00b26]